VRGNAHARFWIGGGGSNPFADHTHINMLGEYDYSDEKLNTITPFQLPKILELKLL
jgi:hypothetical protein